MPKNELFLGGLSKDTRRQDLEDIFSKYGKLTRCDIKYVNGILIYDSLFQIFNLFILYIEGYAGTAYGFVGFEDERDAEVSQFNFTFYMLHKKRSVQIS